MNLITHREYYLSIIAQYLANDGKLKMDNICSTSINIEVEVGLITTTEFAKFLQYHKLYLTP